MSEGAAGKKLGCLAKLSVTAAVMAVAGIAAFTWWQRTLPEPDWEAYRAAAEENAAARDALERISERSGRGSEMREEKLAERPAEENNGDAGDDAAAASARAGEILDEIVGLAIEAEGDKSHGMAQAIYFEPDAPVLERLVRLAGELSQLYDLGGRVPEEQARQVELWQLGGLRHAIIEFAGGYRELDLGEKWLESMKARRAIEVPMGYYPQVMGIEEVLAGTGELNETVGGMDAELLARRGRMDWPGELGRLLRQIEWESRLWEDLAQPSQSYPFYRRAFEVDAASEDGWEGIARKAATPVIARGAALFGWRRLIEPKLTMLAVEQEAMAEYVRALEAGETVNAETQGEVSRAMAPWHVDLTLGRVMAAALEMRQGAAVPAAAEIGEESWLWDPLMQRPYSMARSEENDGRVTVYIYRDYGEQREVQGRVSVAAGQAGLEGLEVIGPDDPMATSRIY